MIHPLPVSVDKGIKAWVSPAHQLHPEECRLTDIHRPVIRLSRLSLAASVGPFLPDKVILQLFLKKVSVDLIEGLGESPPVDESIREIRCLEEEDVWILLLREECLACFYVFLYRVIVSWCCPFTNAVLLGIIIAHLD